MTGRRSGSGAFSMPARRWRRQRGIAQISAGCSTGRHHAYRLMVERGFRTQLMGVQMLRPWREGFDRPDVWAIDDWR